MKALLCDTNQLFLAEILMSSAISKNLKINQRTQGSDNKTKKELQMNEKGRANYELKFIWLVQDFQTVIYG